ncbi:G-alpha-domain-containing protein [Trametes coccinea BRFM310]|uniref:G-alpha-domain-containing protein n=1 Tax=Trametes coccinea (strain BRFM310) TaxID=1353009 RepID=A0A1Y2IJB5_TRAC3|nr:G-alpha-domain-containing protein [Trametes coccinea BRFM310]
MVLDLESSDPLAAAIAPPPNETPEQRWAREQREAQARRISEQIDEQIRAEKQAMKKRKPMKLLLLGQSESGKSTTVKNFQLAYAYDAFLAERAAWRAVIHLNLVRSVNGILDVLYRELPEKAFTTDSGARSYTPGLDLGPLDADIDEEEDEREFAGFSECPLTDSHRALMLRLGPLRKVQRDLERFLGAASSEEVHTGGVDAAPWNTGGWRPREFAVTARSGWKAALGRMKTAGRMSFDSTMRRSESHRRSDGAAQDAQKQKTAGHSSVAKSSSSARYSEKSDDAEVESAADIIATCAEDMWALWTDNTVRAILDKRSMRPEEGPGFFLNDVMRVAARGYEPTEDDVVRARLRTMGVQEHRIMVEKGTEAGYEWIIYDVGGARSLNSNGLATQRHAWYPYFDDINAIIFLAPISCFDERLAEDKRVNRLQDSLLLWKAVCSTKLLAKVQLILFLNKCDLLEKKLARGVRVVDYIPTFGSKPNDLEHVSRYFRSQFKDISARHSPTPRTFYSFLTTAVDTKATRITVATVREGIQRNNLKSAVLF